MGTTVTVDYATIVGTATPGTDYQPVSGTLTFTSETPNLQQITVNVNGDTTFEPNEAFIIRLSNLTGAAIFNDFEGIGIIFNDDPQPSGSPTPTPTPMPNLGLEGDVVDSNGSSAGGDGVQSNDVTIVRLFALGLLTPDPNTNQFQRADVSPRDPATGTYGDGRIDASDVTVVRLYNLGLLPPTTAAGPTMPIATLPEDEFIQPAVPDVGRIIRAVSTTGAAGQQMTLSIELDSQGDEGGASYSLNFNPTVFGYVSSSVGIGGLSAGCSLGSVAGQTAMGRLGVLLDCTNVFATGTRQLMTVRFNVAANAPAGTYPITFGNVPTSAFVVNPNTGDLLPTTFESGNIAVTNGNPVVFTVSGRVTTPTGLSLRNASAVLIDALGTRRTATTSSFGLYSFDNVPQGQYIITVASKRYRFAARNLSLATSLTDVDFVGLE